MGGYKDKQGMHLGFREIKFKRTKNIYKSSEDVFR